MRRLHSFWLLVVGSVAVVTGLGALMLWKDSGQTSEPLVVYCAAAFSEPMAEIAPLFEQQKGVRIEVRFGKSQEILTGLKLTKQGDVFLPADDNFIDLAEKDGLLGETLPLVRMNAVLVVNKKANRSIATWDDLFKGADAKLAIASEGAAVRELTRSRLSPARWKQLTERSVSLGTVTDVANAVALGGAVTAGIIWDSVARGEKYRDQLQIVPLQALDDMQAAVKIGVVKDSRQYANAQAFATFVSTSCADIFQKHGFTPFANSGLAPVTTDKSPGPASTAARTKEGMTGRPEILIFAGAMLRPAIEETLKEFEQREGVDIITVYHGCGILVSKMKAGARPDIYFSCDTSFMNKVSDLFEKPTIVSKNQLVIAVKKGNPHSIRSLTDLGKSGLRVGVGHEQQCALGAITQGVLIRTGTLKSITENVKVRSPSGDLLINQLRTGSLDAVVAYISNVKPYDDIEGIKVEEVNCAPAQPIAIGRHTAHADVVERLIKEIESARSKERFEKYGFGWEIAP
jgi:molybdate transport system substrate-binding protein